jgi:hypothetical protein
MAVGIIVLVSIFTSGFAWSWGPLGWLVPSEIQPLETRSTGQAITVSVNFIFTAVIGQAFLTMLCTMQYGIFLFFAGCVAIMTLFVLVFLPGAPRAARQRPGRRCAAHAGQRRSMFARPHVLSIWWSQGAVSRCMPACQPEDGLGVCWVFHSRCMTCFHDAHQPPCRAILKPSVPSLSSGAQPICQGPYLLN